MAVWHQEVGKAVAIVVNGCNELGLAFTRRRNRPHLREAGPASVVQVDLTWRIDGPVAAVPARRGNVGADAWPAVSYNPDVVGSDRSERLRILEPRGERHFSAKRDLK